MKVFRMAALAGAAAATLGLGLAGSAQAAPVFIQAAQSVGNGVYIEIRTQSQGGTRCKVNLFARVFMDSTPLRSVGGHGRQTVDGCDEQGIWNVTIPANLRSRGRYVVCVRATNNNDYGQPIAHTSCRRFRG